MRQINSTKYLVLLTVADCGSLTEAASRLGYTQSGISHIIAELEEECGFPLVLRAKQGSRLTREGERLMPAIRALLNANEQLEQTVAEINGMRSGTVRVGMFSSVAVHWAPEMTELFLKKYPNIEISIFDGPYHEIENKVLSGELDCGFLTKQTRKALDFIELARDELLAVAPPGHPFAALKALPIDMIGSADFIIPGEGSNYDIGSIFAENGVTPRARYAFSDDHAAIAMVERGMGVTILPSLILSGVSANVVTLPLEPAFARTIGIILPRTKHKALSPAARAFIEFAVRWSESREQS